MEGSGWSCSPRARSLIKSHVYGEMARRSLSTAGRIGGFVGLLLGFDVVALEYPVIGGPIAPTLGGAVAGLIVTIFLRPRVLPDLIAKISALFSGRRR